MRFKYILLLPAILLYSNVFSQQKPVYTLDQCIKNALEGNHGIKSSTYEMLAAEKKVKSASADFFPSIDVAALYSRLNRIDEFSIALPGGSGTPITIYPSIVNNYGVNVTVRQPVFTGARLTAGKKIAENQYKSKEYSFEETRNNVIYTVTECFWQLIYAIESKKVIEESVSMIKRHLADANNLKANGMASENDIKKIEVRLSSMELMKATMEKNISLSKSALCRIMNIPLDQDYTPEYDLTAPGQDFSVEELNAKAIENRPLLKSVQSGVEAASASVKAVKSALYPSVYLTGMYSYARPNRSIFPVKDRWNDTWSIGLSLQYNLWNHGKKNREYEAAKIELSRAKNDLDNLRSQLELDLRRIYLSMRESVEKHRVSTVMVEQAEENYKVSREKYNNGMLLSSELLDAEVDLLKSKLEVTKSIMEFNVLAAELRKAAGKSNE